MCEPLEPIVYDFGRVGHECPECGIGLSTVRCSDSCPHYLTCEDAEQHVAAGESWCPIEKEGLRS